MKVRLWDLETYKNMGLELCDGEVMRFKGWNEYNVVLLKDMGKVHDVSSERRFTVGYNYAGEPAYMLINQHPDYPNGICKWSMIKRYCEVVDED